MDNQPIEKWSWVSHMNRSIAEALSELEREAHVRKRCYDRWVKEGRVSLVDAWDRQERLLSAIKLLRDYETAQQRAAELQGNSGEVDGETEHLNGSHRREENVVDVGF